MKNLLLLLFPIVMLIYNNSDVNLTKANKGSSGVIIKKDLENPLSILYDNIHQNGINLQEHEDGKWHGNSIKDYINISKEIIYARNAGEAKGVASSFYDLESANKAITSAVLANWGEIRDWIVEHKPNTSYLKVTQEYDYNIGYFISSGDKVISDASALIMFLTIDNGTPGRPSFKIVTAHPIKNPKNTSSI